MIKLYHNPRCRKSREALELLRDKNLEVNVVEYLKEPLSKEELTNVIQLLGIHPADLIRKNEAEYKEHYKGKDLLSDQWIDAMVQFPKLMERPIVINGNKAIVGRPPENVLEVL